jgi:hypothetical protein
VFEGAAGQRVKAPARFDEGIHFRSVDRSEMPPLHTSFSMLYFDLHYI